MLSLCSVFSRYCSLAALIDGLGFSNFLEGMIPSLFLQVRQQGITRRHLHRHAAHWCNGLIVEKPGNWKIAVIVLLLGWLEMTRRWIQKVALGLDVGVAVSPGALGSI